MSVPYLPAWVLDLVAAVESFEDTHPKADACLADALNAVPADVRGYAQGYVRGKKTGTPDGGGGVDGTRLAAADLSPPVHEAAPVRAVRAVGDGVLAVASVRQTSR